MEIWGGIECSINRVKDQYFNQLVYQGHYSRIKDLELLVELGIKKIRYPILWEQHQVNAGEIEWGITERNLLFLKEHHIEVIAGLVHHGSGPTHVQISDDSFAEGLAAYAEQVAIKFPWINYFTPVNEPLTTARFCGLYGLWYPHRADEQSFLRIFINECKASVLAMQAIRKVNPNAKMVHTEDLGKTHSTPHLKYQADFENERRWLGLDLICGMVNEQHKLYDHLLKNGITGDELNFFSENPGVPDILGFNYYVTSERYIDEALDIYPEHLHGGNGKCRYADVEAVRVAGIVPAGVKALLTEAWERYKRPMAVTEAHLYCGREDQLRWLNGIWKAAHELRDQDINIVAVTAWSLFGAFGWDKLLTVERGNYENGAFDISAGHPRVTAVAKMIKSLSEETPYTHAVMNGKAWWENETRIIYPVRKYAELLPGSGQGQPVMIIGGTGTLGNAFVRVCARRQIKYVAPVKSEVNLIFPEQIEQVIQKYKPWAIINAAGYVNVDAAEMAHDDCFSANAIGVENLALCCRKYNVKLITFSSDLVFDGKKCAEYLETDPVNPLNIYGQSKALAERHVLASNKDALIVRSSAFFGPWDKYNFVFKTLDLLAQKQTLKVPYDVFISPTYVPDLVDRTIDLMIDDESGIWHLANQGTLTWYEFAREACLRSGVNSRYLLPATMEDMGLQAKRPRYSALKSSRGSLMPTLEHALDRLFN